VTLKPSELCKPAENVYTNFFGTIGLTQALLSPRDFYGLC